MLNQQTVYVEMSPPQQVAKGELVKLGVPEELAIRFVKIIAISQGTLYQRNDTSRTPRSRLVGLVSGLMMERVAHEELLPWVKEKLQVDDKRAKELVDACIFATKHTIT